jgi:hypothetical protein
MKLSDDLRGYQPGYIFLPFDEFADKAAQLESENEALREFVDVVRKNDYWVEWCKLDALFTGEK